MIHMNEKDQASVAKKILQIPFWFGLHTQVMLLITCGSYLGPDF